VSNRVNNEGTCDHLTDTELERLVNSRDLVLLEGHRHLDDCETCQTRLAATAAETWWWNEGRSFVGSSLELLDETSRPPLLHPDDGLGFDPAAAEIDALTENFAAPIHPELLGQIDEYEVQSLLGVGGMGAVFKGFDRELNRPVAIKFLLPSLAKSGVSRQRFSREAKAVAAVRHDNVIPVFRINTTGQYPYFVMPLVAGMSLEQYVMTEGAMDPTQIVQIASQIAAGLAAAHDKGLIHRDIKPANILLENSCNRVVVTDFGLVHDENDMNLTQTGMIAGTPQYMSPEQADGKTLDHRSDLFSFGSVMFWMATGRRPFTGKSQLALLKNIREIKQPDVRSVNPAIPIKLARTIGRLLEKNPSHRFQSAAEVERFLAKYLAHLKAPGKNHEPRLRRRRTIKAWQIVSALSVLLLAVTMLTVFSFLVPPGGNIIVVQSPATGFAPSAKTDRVNTDRMFEKVINVQEGGTLYLRSNLGDVTIETHREPTVILKMFCRVQAKKEAGGQALLNRVALQFESDESGVAKAIRGTDAEISINFPENRIEAASFDTKQDFDDLQELVKQLDFEFMKVVFQLRVPERFTINVETRNGSVSLPDVDGSATVRTSNGFVTAGTVSGDLFAETSAGGLIRAGNIGQDANVLTAGNDIRLGDVGGEATAVTEGGMISMGHVAGDVNATTHGGEIRIATVDGAVQAKTHAAPIAITFGKQPEKDSLLETEFASVTVGLSRDIRLSVEADISKVELNGRIPLSRISRGMDDVAEKQGTDFVVKVKKWNLNGGGPLLRIPRGPSSVHFNFNEQ